MLTEAIDKVCKHSTFVVSYIHFGGGEIELYYKLLKTETTIHG